MQGEDKIHPRQSKEVWTCTHRSVWTRTSYNNTTAAGARHFSQLFLLSLDHFSQQPLPFSRSFFTPSSFLSIFAIFARFLLDFCSIFARFLLAFCSILLDFCSIFARPRENRAKSSKNQQRFARFLLCDNETVVDSVAKGIERE